MANIVLPQDVFTKYKLESIGDESDTAYLANKCRSKYAMLFLPIFSNSITEDIMERIERKLNTLSHYDDILKENLSDKDTEPIIKQLAKNN